MFLLLPTIWMGAMGWAGVNVGMALASISSKGSAEAKSAGQKGGDIVTSAATKGTK